MLNSVGSVALMVNDVTVETRLAVHSLLSVIVEKKNQTNTRERGTHDQTRRLCTMCTYRTRHGIERMIFKKLKYPTYAINATRMNVSNTIKLCPELVY